MKVTHASTRRLSSGIWFPVQPLPLVSWVHTGGSPVPSVGWPSDPCPSTVPATLKLSVTLKSTLSRTQQLPRSPVLSLTRCLVELVT